MSAPIDSGPTSNAPLLSMSSISVKLGTTHALHDVSFDIVPGEIVTVIGPNGAGKTTLARVAIGTVRPDAGTVTRRAGLKTGYVPQRFSIDPTLPLTVNRLMQLTQRASKQDIAFALEQVGALHLSGRQITHLSGGEFQRVLLARALLGKPDLLILDEPSSGIDFSGQAQLYDLISQVRTQTGVAVLMISHDLHVVMAATDHVLCLNTHLCCAGAPDAISNDPAYRELFGIEAGQSLALYHHQHDHAHDLDGHVHKHAAKTKGNTVPEHGRHSHE